VISQIGKNDYGHIPPQLIRISRKLLLVGTDKGGRAIGTTETGLGTGALTGRAITVAGAGTFIGGVFIVGPDGTTIPSFPMYVISMALIHGLSVTRKSSMDILFPVT
jgi:hypothetical protein